MITREYNPFYQLKVEKCEVKDIKGQIIFESYISNTHMCCGDAWVKIISAVFYFKCFLVLNRDWTDQNAAMDNSTSLESKIAVMMKLFF